MTFNEWRQRHPQAAHELDMLLTFEAQYDGSPGSEVSENVAQQRARLSIAKQGGLAWRNNVGALPAESKHCCPRCNFHFVEQQQPVRWGLANDSVKMNKNIKSSDLILCIPRLVTQGMVGSTIGQFGAVETKKPGWRGISNEHEQAQAKFLSLVSGKGGFACFSTGEVTL